MKDQECPPDRDVGPPTPPEVRLPLGNPIDLVALSRDCGTESATVPA